MNSDTAEFDREYERLSESGWCDSPGGGEYDRVKAEWIAAGRPGAIEAFIRKRANWVPDSDEWAAMRRAAEVARETAAKATAERNRKS